MSRKIGKWKNPINGKNDWFEPDKISAISLKNGEIKIMGLNESLEVFFILGNIDEEKVITIKAKTIVNEQTYSSKVLKIDELIFAEQFVEATYNGKYIDETEVIEEAKKTAILYLGEELFENDIYTNEQTLKGIGFVIANNKKLISIDTLIFNYDNVYKIQLKHCTGLASLENLENPKVEFYFSNKILKIEHFEIKDIQEGKIKYYTIEAQNISIVKTDEKIKYTNYNFTKENLNNDDFIDKMLKDRFSMLDIRTNVRVNNFFNDLDDILI